MDTEATVGTSPLTLCCSPWPETHHQHHHRSDGTRCSALPLRIVWIRLWRWWHDPYRETTLVSGVCQKLKPETAVLLFRVRSV